MKTGGQIHIVCCADTNYLRHTAVMLASLFENNTWAEATVHLIGTGIAEKEIKRFRKTIENFGQTVCFYPFDTERLKNLPHGTHRYITSTTWCRLFIQDILPEDIEKAIYLDGDIIVTGNIQGMWEAELGENLVGATSDEVNGYADYYARFGFPRNHVYFNAGVLLINVKEWRKQDIKSRFMEFMARADRPQLDNADQDILNVLCLGKIKELPLRYNLQDAILRRSVPNIRKETLETIEEEIREGRIFHFSCVKKPWHFRCIHPLKWLYYKYQEKTEWRGTMEERREKDVFYMIAYWCAYALGLTNRYRKSVTALAKSKDID